MTPYYEVSTCRSCWGPLSSILRIRTPDGRDPCISTFVGDEDADEEIHAPLEIMRCEGCGLIQTHHTILPDTLFRTYWYQSGMNDSMRAALQDVARAVHEQVPHLEQAAVLDIGANDGTLLGYYPPETFRVAVDPAENFPSAATSVLWFCDYWPMEEAILWTELHAAGHTQFDAITTVASGLYHTDRPNAFVAQIARFLAPDGVWVLQLQDERSVLETGAVDYFCHEHVTLWGRDSLNALLHRHGLCAVDVEDVRVNGGSARYTIRHSATTTQPPTPALEAWNITGSGSAGDWKAFGAHALATRKEARELLTRLAAEGKRVLGVAASTKANTVLQWYGITPDLMPAIVDIDPRKAGLKTVGTHIPIVMEGDRRIGRPDHYVALAWGFLDGFRRRSPDVPFITLLPEVRMYPAYNSKDAS